MKKTALGFALIATTVLAASATTLTAEATADQKTKVGIGFGGDSVINPGPFMDQLSIVYTPSTFDFGTGNELGNNNTVFEQKGAAADGQNLTVIDDRKDDERTTGWTLTGQLSDLTKDGAADGKKLVGKLTLKQDNLQKYNYSKNELNAAKDDYLMPTPGSGAQGKAGSLETLANAADYTVTPKVEFGIGKEAVPVIVRKTAGEKQAVNTKVSDVKIDVTGQEKGTQYSGTISWLLSNAVK